MSSIRPCRDNEHATVLKILNAAAEAYRGAIPEDCWHEPYMPLDELEREIAAGVKFWAMRLTVRWSASWVSSQCAMLI